MRECVIQTIEHDTSLQRIFRYDKVNPITWCQHIITMGTWATSLEKLIFTYLLKCAVVTVGNYTDEFWLSDTRYDLNEVLHIDENFAANGLIHIYHHIAGSPLQRANPMDCNHFAYLQPNITSNANMPINSIEQVSNC